MIQVMITRPHVYEIAITETELKYLNNIAGIIEGDRLNENWIAEITELQAIDMTFEQHVWQGVQ